MPPAATIVDDARQHRRNAEAARKVADEALHEADQPRGKTVSAHNVGGKDEKWNAHQRKTVEPGKHALRQDRQRDLAGEGEGDECHPSQRDEHRQRRRERHCEQRKHDQGRHGVSRD